MSKILYFIETGGAGGAERVVLDLARGMSGRGHEVAVCTLRTGWLTERLGSHGVEHIHLQSNGSDPGLPIRLGQLLHENGVTVLHSHLLDSNFYGAIAARLAGTRHVATEHGDVHHLQPKRFLRTKLKIAQWSGASFTAVSRYTAEQMVRLGVRRDKITIVGNPLPSGEPSAASPIRRELGIGEPEWVWVHVANMRKVKDQATLLRGFAGALRHSSAQQRLLLAGEGPERDELATLCETLGIKNSVHFLGHREDVPALLRAADGFILSSVSEALPMSLLEAAQAGLVLVTSDVGGLPEIVRPDETGYLFRAGDHCALAKTLASILENTSGAEMLGLRGQKEALAKFSLPKILDAYSRLYFG